MCIILVISTLFLTAMSVTRERERGTMENLLAMPVRPVEVMLGKIVPYIGIGFVRRRSSLSSLSGCSACRCAGAALLRCSAPVYRDQSGDRLHVLDLAQNQLQAMQMSMMFFLPNILLSGFMFPFAGMPKWAQWIGEFLPLTHYLRIVRGVMLKGANLSDLRYDTLALAGLMLIAMAVAISRFRRTLD